MRTSNGTSGATVEGVLGQPSKTAARLVRPRTWSGPGAAKDAPRARARPALSRGEKGCLFSVRPLVGRRCTAAAHWRSGEESPRQAHRPRSDVPPSWARGRPTSCGARAPQCQRLLWHGRSSATTRAKQRPGPPHRIPAGLGSSPLDYRAAAALDCAPLADSDRCVCLRVFGRPRQPAARYEASPKHLARAGGAFSALACLEKARPNIFDRVENIGPMYDR
ncbi:hypothetical protein HPB51_024932 [Rhipicephalus microplus]|uniref:Uncharacterized protein n=1 Tax=Rhipicephalus microplus TaxID=6941 RepID=A0A9J6DDF0_RHIMP|nr:hypothetical protein HPB51_024932 [Rhipicephalus microplus]